MALSNKNTGGPPPLISLPRITTLIASLIVALSSGTNYVYSAYAPQLGARFGISHTLLNIVGLAGNIGVYSSGPLWGRIVDKRGPRILLASSFALLLAGYAGMRFLYDTGLPAGATSISTLGLCILILFSFMTGAGGNGGFIGSVNSTAKSFPDQARATATGIVISGFGLSAFFFSTLSHIFYAGNTSVFLLVLAVGTSVPMIMGFFFVRPIPLPEADGYNEIRTEDDRDEGEIDEERRTTALEHDESSHTRLLHEDHIDGDDIQYIPRRGSQDVGHRPSASTREMELGLNQSHGPSSSDIRVRSLSRGAALELDIAPNLRGLKLCLNKDFLLLFSILSILSGTGLMYINNVGSMSQALYAHQTSKYDEAEAAGWQATQVSTISLMNFSGRIFIGLVSDFGKNRFSIPRSYCLALVSFSCFISQVITAMEDRIENLWVASALLGLAYGSAFSLFPNVCLEWFGMPHFSENWGYLSLSPMIAGNIFSVVFGQNLDAHDGSVVKKSLPSTITAAAETVTRTVFPRSNVTAPQCLEGLDCYVDTIYLTIAATFTAILLSIWAGYRDRQKIRAAALKKAKFDRRSVVA